MTVEQPLNLLTVRQIQEMPISGFASRTPRHLIEQPLVPKVAKKEVRIIWDVSGSNDEETYPGSGITKRQFILELAPQFVRLLEDDDYQAKREQSGGSSKKGGLRTWYANEPQPIMFKVGEDESDDPRDGGDHNTANVQEQLAKIPWGGRTFIGPAIVAAEHASEVELDSLPADEKWDAMVTMLVTDGMISDPDKLDAWLEHAGPHNVIGVTVIGSGDGHDAAVEHYKKLAKENRYLTMAALTGVSSADEAVLDLRLLSGTAPE